MLARSSATPGPDSAANSLRSYVLSLARFAGARRLSRLSLLPLLTALTDGVGFFLLVPILELLASPGGGRSAISRALAALGVLQTLQGLLLTFFVVVTLRFLLVRVRHVATHRLGLEFADHIRGRLVASVARAAWPFLARRRMSDLAKAFTSDVMYIAAGTYFALQLPAFAVLIVAHASVAVGLAPLLATATLAVAAALGFVLRGQIRQVYELGRAVGRTQEDIYHETSEFLAGMKLAKSSAAEGRHVAACVSATAALRSQQLGFIRANSASHMQFQIGAALAMTLLVFLGSTVARLPAAEVVVLAAVLARLLPLVLESVRQLQEVVHSLPTFATVERIIGECRSAAEEAEEEEGAGRHAPTLACELRLEDVSFRYDELPGPDVLRGVSLLIRAGRMTAVTGPSGSGKSTLADLVMGLLEPTRGRLTIDGVPLLRSRARAWRRSIAYVPQECFLFRDSVRANLLWARADAGDEDLWNALTLAAAADFVSALPQGLDTVIGDRGLRLSGGERQRLAIARALLRQPQLLVLDEATSALDYENERLVRAAIQGMQGLMTILMITHRLAAVRGADEIVVLVDGRIRERGTWHDLVERRGGWLATTLRPSDWRSEAAAHP